MIAFPEIDPARRLELLNFPEGKIRAVLDTDTFNEIDDQFAVSYAMLSPEKIDMRAITAAPFFNSHSTGPEDGMLKSYDEIKRILALLKISPEGFVYRGSRAYLPNRETFVESEAARRITELVHEAKNDGTVLYVMAIGAITNVASAILMDPSIIENMVVVWLGGHAMEWPGKNNEFNFYQDVPASQVIFESGVPLIQYPCRMVVDHMSTTEPELAASCRDVSPIGKFLYDRTVSEMGHLGNDSRVIWDIVTVANFMQPDAVQSELRPSPRIADDGAYIREPGRYEFRYVYYVNRDAIFRDLFARLAKAPK